jgi:hypothetical protein
MGFLNVLGLRKRLKWRTIIALVLLVNMGVHSGQTVNRRNHQKPVVNGPSHNNGKRNVLYNYVTDRPRIPFGDFHQAGSNISPRSNLASIQGRMQRIGELLKYRQYIDKLYAKRRSDIDSPILEGDIPDYENKKDYEESPGSPLAGNQLKAYESVEDVNKKYGQRMVGLNYFTKDVLPTDHVILPQQDYHSPIERGLGATVGYPQYSQTSNEVANLNQPVLSKDASEVERLIELEKLRELEELRGRRRTFMAT